jgi:prepilin-type processing-associated H-X9-DG protein/prepilin-type N-terminal cleavage/methylation domain-containing protein
MDRIQSNALGAKMSIRRRPRGRSAFTLTELLVTVGVLGVLASLLFPALSAAKDKARGIKCVSNLSQIGKALAMYEGQEHAYPGAGSPVLEVKKKLLRTDDSWDGKLLPLLANATNVLNCPSARRETWGPAIKIDDYGYNANGVCRMWDFTHNLGLGYGSHNIDGKLIPATLEEVIRSADVRAPAEMIAIGDFQTPPGVWNNIITANILPEQNGGLTSALAGRHRGVANVLFCDGHVESAKVEQWNAATDKARKRWNNDHDAHVEIWK